MAQSVTNASSVFVTLDDGVTEYYATRVRLDQDRLRMMARGEPIDVPASRVLMIEQDGDSLRDGVQNGAVFGALGTTAVWVILSVVDRVNGPTARANPLKAEYLGAAIGTSAAIGAFVGAGFDAIISGRQSIYRRGSPGSAGQLRRLELRANDSLKNGAIIGAASVGSVFAWFLIDQSPLRGRSTWRRVSVTTQSALLGVSLGGLVGMGIDALNVRHVPVFRADRAPDGSPRASLHLSLFLNGSEWGQSDSDTRRAKNWRSMGFLASAFADSNRSRARSGRPRRSSSSPIAAK
jgi:hypothetical protein